MYFMVTHEGVGVGGGGELVSYLTASMGLSLRTAYIAEGSEKGPKLLKDIPTVRLMSGGEYAGNKIGPRFSKIVYHLLMDRSYDCEEGESAM